jgi:hypothetical protein
MARPRAPIVLTLTDDSGEIIIMTARAVWIVEYKNKPISATRTTWGITASSTKYTRTNFSNPAHAYKLADKLNKMFDTEEFTVREI